MPLHSLLLLIRIGIHRVAYHKDGQAARQVRLGQVKSCFKTEVEFKSAQDNW